MKLQVTAVEILPSGLQIGVKEGKIACIGYDLEAHDGHTLVVDAEGAFVTPGGVDSHVHTEEDNAPTGDTWETGTRSAIAGGNTTIIAFASQKRSEESLWPTLTEYHRRASNNAYCDYGFHVILTNPSHRIMEEELLQLVEQEGVTSVKLYMTYEPLKMDDGGLFNVMMKTRNLGMTTMVHAENHDIIEQITRRLAEHGQTSTYFHSIARPQLAESEATYRAISIAEVTQTPILIVHMSAPTAVAHVANAQRRLLPIHAEICPQYFILRSNSLVSGADDFEGAKYICAPPLRHSDEDLDAIWMGLANGTFNVVSSDHAPSMFEHPCGKMRGLDLSNVQDEGEAQSHKHGDFRRVPNGLPGIETRLPLLFDRSFAHRAPGSPLGNIDRSGINITIPLPRFVSLTSTNPAKLYGLDYKKGSLQPSYDADIVIWYNEKNENYSGPFTITNSSLHHRIDYTPYEGMSVRNLPRYVFLRGQMAWDRDGGGVVGKKGDGLFLKRGKGQVLTGMTGCNGEGNYWM